jgi:signal transduction histidine kinase
VEMTINVDECEVKIIDNGKGFQMPVPPGNLPPHIGRGGNGLKNMLQRLIDIGGECLVDSRPDIGTTVTMRIRLTKKALKK